ncbi:MAG: hypothetical protein Q4F53_01365 [Nesterenkonia sp.]|nr:hypothetical protein [Nesterenkonia sp.]
MRSFNWFTFNNRTTVADIDFLKSLGVQIDSPMGIVNYARDEDSGIMMGCLGHVFVRTDGVIKVRPHHGLQDNGLQVLLRTAVDCLERDMHLRERWEYRRKTKKRGGYWRCHVFAGINPNSEAGRSIEALSTAILREDAFRPPGLTDIEGAPQNPDRANA